MCIPIKGPQSGGALEALRGGSIQFEKASSPNRGFKQEVSYLENGWYEITVQ